MTSPAPARTTRTPFERAAAAEAHDRYKESPTLRDVFIAGAEWAHIAKLPRAGKPLSIRDTIAKALYDTDPTVPQSGTGWRHPWGNLPTTTQTTYRRMADAALVARDRHPDTSEDPPLLAGAAP